MRFEAEVNAFLIKAHALGLRVILVGGAAVNHHGYKRHSADVDLWIEPSRANFDRLIEVLNALGYDVQELPDKVMDAEQNITIKISPEQEIELITRFNPGCSFGEAWDRCVFGEIDGVPVARYRVLALDDLVASKVKSARPKDLLDVLELRRRSAPNDPAPPA
ncbi:MAG TPA: hypothetical protein PLH93_02055 [Flavobacteriales bacterium]|nr:hypothetical protein [Flavobacteriales bacterium]HQW85934.1 hypothetical protein [Flavobacteriales bacterium]